MQCQICTTTDPRIKKWYRAEVWTPIEPYTLFNCLCSRCVKTFHQVQRLGGSLVHTEETGPTKAEIEKRNSWIANLSVGDLVCDCNYKHQKIVEAWPEQFLPNWLRNRLFFFPYGDRLVEWLEQQLPARFLVTYDQILVLEDGRGCSARNCCHPAPHPTWTH